MSWIDDFGAVAGAFGAAPAAPSRGYTSWNAQLSSGGFGGSSRSSALINWSDLASGSLGAGSYFSAPSAKALAHVPAAPPERFDVKYPVRGFGAPPVPRPPQSTQGDIFGSALGAVGNTFGSLNLANVVPWFMERVNVLADEFSKSDNPAIAGPAGLAKIPLDLFANGVKAASDFAGPVLDAFPTLVRDGQLHDRAKLYRAIVSGGAADFGFGGPISNPLSIFAQLSVGLTPGGFGVQAAGRSGASEVLGRTVSSQNTEYDQYRNLLLHTVDPNGRATIEQRMGVLREAIDLPMSVKIAVERNPNLSDDEIEKLLSEAPEGRQWSYQGGIPGAVQNMGTPLLFYLAEARALGLAGRGVSAFGGAAGGTAGAVVAGTGRAVSTAAALQKYAMAAGLGTTAVTTTMDGVARWMGNQAAIDWFDRINRTSKFSDDPAVQLVTSFSVNPFSAAKLAIKGGKVAAGVAGKVAAVPARVTIALANGIRGIDVSADTAARMDRFAGSDASMVDMIRRMYRLHSDAEAQAFIAQNYEHKGEAFDEVLGVALEEHVARLPPAERAVLDRSFPDPIEYTRHVAETYADSAMTLLETDAQAVASRWQERSWAHHNYPGRFSPEVAAANARDFRLAKARTYQMRAELDAVVGYREFLPPQGQALARSWLDGATVDGRVAVEGSGGIQDLIRQFPAMRKYWTGLITNETHVPRSSVERMIDRAQADWQRVAKQNPVKARTGGDPILRPNSPTLSRDTAEALGTSVETLDAIDGGAPTADALSLIRQFAVSKLDRTPEQAAAMTPEEAVAAAQKYVADTTAPWRRAGEDVAAAEKQMTTLRSELARLNVLPRRVVEPRQIIELERQYAALNTLIRAASDPIVPFVTEAAHGRPEGIRAGRDIQLTELATRRAEATTRLHELATIDDAGAALAGDDWHSLFRLVEGQVGYSGNLPAMSAGMRRALRYAAGMGDYEAWATLGNNLDRVEHLLTRAQRARAHAVLDAGGWKHQNPGETIGRANVSGGLSEDAAIEEVARLWSARNGILAGTSEYALRRTADLRLPPQYVALADEMAASGSVERGILHDPLFARQVHPANVARLQDALATPDTFPAARAIIDADPVLADRYAAFMLREGMVAGPNDLPAAAMDLFDGTRVNFTYDVLGDFAYLKMLDDALIPADFVRPVPGVLVPEGLWDQAILANDRPALEGLARDFKLDQTPALPVSVPARVAKLAATNVPKQRPSVRYARRLAEADTTASPDAAVTEAPGNRIGLDVLSVMNHGITGTRPATVNRVLELLREIENGNAKRAGIGGDLAAEAQRVANELLDAAVRDAPRPETTGIFTKGIFPEDEMGLAAEIDHLLKYDDANPLGTLQYGLKKRPADAVVLEWSQVPGLAEELMTSRFAPYAERAGAAQVRQAFNFIFGPRSNAAVRAAAKVRFLERATAQGVDGETASAIHDAWRKIAKESRSDTLRRTPTGERRYVSGDNPLYADVPNIPSAKLDAIAQRTIDELSDAGKIAGEDFYVSKLHKVDYAALFRESTSFIRRSLADNAGSLGHDLARAYGMVAHNKAVTTSYYWFRFGLDMRFHAMNYLEAQFLYMGRAGLRKGEISQGQLGMTEQYLRHLDADPMSNTGYQFSQDRMAWAYRTFLKEQPDALRGALKGLDAEDHAMMRRFLDQLAENDPQVRDMRRIVGDDPAKYLNELDRWHQKMLDSASLDENAALIDETLAQAYRESPDLANVLARLGDVNKDLWDNVRQTFYGNPNRSRAERFLNSYLLFWPLSYQIKSTRWFAKVLLDRAGGIQTNAGGAYLFDGMAQTHQRLLATDPEYMDWFEQHPTAVFLAQMLFPVSFEGTGVSLNPAMRSLFFGRAKAIWDIGPVYTFNHVVKPIAKELYADLYPTLKDVPGFDGIYRATTGQAEPKLDAAALSQP